MGRTTQMKIFKNKNFFFKVSDLPLSLERFFTADCSSSQSHWWLSVRLSLWKLFHFLQDQFGSETSHQVSISPIFYDDSDSTKKSSPFYEKRHLHLWNSLTFGTVVIKIGWWHWTQNSHGRKALHVSTVPLQMCHQMWVIVLTLS